MKKMEELHEGQAKLTGLCNASETFDVVYSISFRFELQNRHAGLPCMAFKSASVNYVQSIDGRNIPTGEYLLEREHEINKVENIGIWQMMSWPEG
ncbi:hypothetical protein H7849_00460 [Alloacidobacterium dinghuense]|uniref:Uncharacterized protein n=1 Tax=Alloacidobacterium dinghuense TaxID=2763107 RepID=A0A7G8BJ21_9BACT|nr:hypothetical protein [Alloacidobacterium dinghuense]QNI32541.1 hypothetical protein H7849_00460 [Alloacidobacterium dinghuense]